jgi:3-deoxy-7-phosphoheptulonate synthase
MIDCSHGNSSKQFLRQKDVAADVADQIANGDTRIIGVMIESHLKEGRQEHIQGAQLEYGKSITDACLGWEDSVNLLERLALGVRARRQKLGGKAVNS